MAKVNIDIVSNLLEYTSIADLDSTISGFMPEVKEEYIDLLKQSRTNPFTLFKQLTDDPEELMYMMTVCKVILSGSQAAEWFCPGVATSESDWDFYGSSNHLYNIPFILYLSSIGAQWKPNYGTGFDYPLDISILSGRLKRNNKIIKLQFITRMKHFHTASANVVTFSSSICQCFISGFAAVAYYGKLTCDKKSLRWSKMGTTHYRNINFNTDDISHVLRYKDRGIKYIPYEQYIIQGYSRTKDKVFDVTQNLERDRYVGDSETLVVPFNEFFATGKMKNLCEVYSAGLGLICWSECPYSLVISVSKNLVYNDDREFFPTNESIFKDKKPIRFKDYNALMILKSVEIKDKETEHTINRLITLLSSDESGEVLEVIEKSALLANLIRTSEIRTSLRICRPQSGSMTSIPC